jgi:predicted Fe-S protein YdhL (DUF1289 family)
MSDEISLSQFELLEIPSPCIRVCTTNNRGYCLGCLRSRDERFNWLKFSEQEKRIVIELCKRRRNYISKKKYEKHEEEIQKTLNSSSDLFSSNENDDLFKD